MALFSDQLSLFNLILEVQRMRNVLSRKSGKQKYKVCKKGVVHLLTANGRHKSYRIERLSVKSVEIVCFSKKPTGKDRTEIHSSPFQLFHGSFAINTQDLIPTSHCVKQNKKETKPPPTKYTHLDTGSFLAFSVSHLNMIALSVPVQHKSHCSVCPSWDSSTKILGFACFQHRTSPTKSAQ